MRAVAIDDLQWVDRPSAAALEYALRRLHRDEVKVLATLRSNGAKQQPPMLAGLPDERLTRLRVEPLSLGPTSRHILPEGVFA